MNFSERFNLKESHDAHKFVFVCGLHKSGTSILFQCLREHPSISGFQDTGVPKDEGQFLQSVFPVAKEFGGPGIFGFHADMHLTESSVLLIEENKQKLFFEWARYWDTSKPVLLEKSPPNLLRTRFLQAIFPRSYVIVIIRHPIAVSYATQSQSKTSLISLLRHWIYCHKIFWEDKPYLQNCLILNYENFVKNVDYYLHRIYTFIGVENYLNHLEILSNTNDKYLMQWVKDQQQANWLRRYFRQRAYQKIEREINWFGYSLYDPERDIHR